MSRQLFLLAIVGVILTGSISCFAQEENKDNVLVIREAKERGKIAAAVEAYLVADDMLEVTVTARMDAAKPRIFSVLIVGSKLGRISAIERETLFANALDEENPFLTQEVTGFIKFDQSKKEKKLKGTLSRELHKFRIPTEKVIPGKRYQLWVKVDSMRAGGKHTNFKFDLPDFPNLFRN